MVEFGPPPIPPSFSNDNKKLPEVKGFLEGIQQQQEERRIKEEAEERKAKLITNLQNLEKAMARLENDHSNPAELMRLQQQAIQLRIKLGLPS